jgi:hypothetical protein
LSAADQVHRRGPERRDVDSGDRSASTCESRVRDVVAVVVEHLAHRFGKAPRVAFEVPEVAAAGQPVDADVPIHALTRGEGRITRLRIGFGNTGKDEVTILRLFTSVDTRHNWNNANFVLAAATYFNWTGDVDFLSRATLR